jgi:ribonucleoside-diphosphate reductase subunit M2
MEPILSPSNNRFTTFPIKYPDLWELFKKAQASNWTAEEIDLSSDMVDWVKLSDNEQHFIKRVLAFFAASDGIVFENLQLNFATEVQISEARAFYSYQGYNENVHGETYSLLIEKYVSDQAEKDSLFTSIDTVPCIRKKAEWAMSWFDSEKRSFAERLIAFACVEGIFFSGSFCSIFWLKNRGLLPGLSFSNELISRDEALHLEFAVALFEHLESKPSTKTIHQIVKEAVEIEKEFIIDALPCKLIGMDSEKMSRYIEYVADRLMKQLGYITIYDAQNPFDWMENISLDGKTNFFEKRVGEYAKHMDTTEVKFDEEF